MALLRTLFDDLPWYQLVPEDDRALMVEGYGADAATALTARTADGRLSVSYIPSNGTDGRTLTAALGGFAGPVAGRWYNPTNGKAFRVAGSPFVNRDTRRLHTPGDNGTGADDWVLILEAK